MADPYTQGLESITQAEHISPAKTGDNVQAKRVAQYDTPDGVNWQRAGTQYAVRVDDTSEPGITYIGKAPIGSAASSSVWQVQKLDQTSGVVKTWADGDALFNNVWDNRLSLSYS